MRLGAFCNKMMFLLTQKWSYATHNDVAACGSNDAMFANYAVRRNIIHEVNIIDEINIICPQGQTSFGWPAIMQVAAPHTPIFKEFTKRDMFIFLHCALIWYFMRHPERAILLRVEQSSAYKRLPLEVAKRHEGLRKQLSVVFPRVWPSRSETAGAKRDWWGVAVVDGVIFL